MCSAEEFAAPSNSAPEALGEEGVTRFSGPLAPRDSVAIRAGDGALWSVGPSSARADSLWPPFAIVPRIRRCSLRLLARILRASRYSAEPSRFVLGDDQRPTATSKAARPNSRTRQAACTRRSRDLARPKPVRRSPCARVMKPLPESKSHVSSA